MRRPPRFSRRRYLAYTGALAGTMLLPPAVRAAVPMRATPAQTPGPFYPDELPLDTDNDLIRVDDGPPAKGQVTNLIGRLRARDGNPVAEARIEIWQCDANGRYHHQDDPNTAAVDPNFQGFGTTTTDADGRYRFRTIKPVPYAGRTPHIHVRVKGETFPTLTTQLYIRGHAQNERDGIYRSIPPCARKLVLAEFAPSTSDSAELEAHWDIVLGVEAIALRD